MQYRAVVARDGRTSIAEFPDCPGCHTQAEPGEDFRARAQEALEDGSRRTSSWGGFRPSRRPGVGVPPLDDAASWCRSRRRSPCGSSCEWLATGPDSRKKRWRGRWALASSRSPGSSRPRRTSRSARCCAWRMRWGRTWRSPSRQSSRIGLSLGAAEAAAWPDRWWGAGLGGGTAGLRVLRSSTSRSNRIGGNPSSGLCHLGLAAR